MHHFVLGSDQLGHSIKAEKGLLADRSFPALADAFDDRCNYSSKFFKTKSISRSSYESFQYSGLILKDAFEKARELDTKALFGNMFQS